MRRQVGTAVGFWFFLGVACQPDKPQPANSPDTVALLTGGSSRTWRMQTRSVGGTGTAIEPCRADDRWTFRSDQTATWQNSTPCQSNDPNDPSPSVSARWRLTNSNRFLVIEGASLFLTREIIQLSDNLLVWEYTGEGGKLVQETWVP